MNAEDVIVNGLSGTALAFLGTLLLSLVRAPKILDDEQSQSLLSAQTTIRGQALRIADLESKRTPQDEYHYQETKKYLDACPDDTKKVLRLIILRQRLVGGDIPQVSGVDSNRVTEILNSSELKALVKIEDHNVLGFGLRRSWLIIPGYSAALSELLYPGDSI